MLFMFGHKSLPFDQMRDVSSLCQKEVIPFVEGKQDVQWLRKQGTELQSEKLEHLSKIKVFQGSIQRVTASDCLYSSKWLRDSLALGFGSHARCVICQGLPDKEVAWAGFCYYFQFKNIFITHATNIRKKTYSSDRWTRDQLIGNSTLDVT